MIIYKRDAEKNPVYAISGVKDFDCDHIFDCGQCFRWRKQEDGSWTGIAGENIANVSYEKGTLYIRGLYGTFCENDLVEFWLDYLDLDRDYGAIKRKLSRGDMSMKEAVKYGQGIRILNQELWEVIISFIISQNNNIPRIKGCIESLAKNFGERMDFTRDKAYQEPKKNRQRIEEGTFDGQFPLGDLTPNKLPSPETLANLTVEDLAPVRLGYRAKYLIQAAKEVLERGLPTNYDELIALTGVGPKVANCIGLFGLRDTESFPIDVWVKRVMKVMYGFDEDDLRGMEKYASSHFGEYSGFAQQYLFYYIRSIDKEGQLE